MASIYEITNDISFINQMLEEGEIDPEALKGALEVSKEDLTIKLEHYCQFIKNLESDNEGLKAEEDRLAEKRKRNEKVIDNMKAAMMFALDQVKEKKIACGSFTVSVQKNAASVVLDCETALIPELYLIPQAPSIDKKKIKQDLQDGLDLSGVAHLESGSSLRIR